ncbi:MAG: tetratricopeptide repeat protein [Planctomycetota bacterium]|jgi:tetratricopeptide (TPR) repeat protein
MDWSVRCGRGLAPWGLLLALVVIGRSGAAGEPLTQLLEFRDAREPAAGVTGEIELTSDLSLAGKPPAQEVKPWQEREKRLVTAYLGAVGNLAPGLIERATAHRPLQLYRATEANLFASNFPIYADPKINGIFVSDEAIASFVSDEPSPRALHMAAHELAHLADPFSRLAWSPEWVRLVKPRVAQVQDAFEKKAGMRLPVAFRSKRNHGPDMVAFMTRHTRQAELPSTYAAYSLREALAEYTSAVVLSAEPAPPEAVRVFVQQHLLATPFAPDPASAHVQQGLRALRSGDPATARGALDAALELDPDLAMAHLYRAEAHEQQQDYRRALADYGRALALLAKAEDLAWPYRDRALLHARLEDPDAAIRDFTASLRLSPDNMAAYNGRGSQWYVKKEYDRAIADFTRAIELAPDDDRNYYNRGLIWRDKQETEEAIADFTAAIRLEPGDASAYVQRLALRFVAGRYAEAVADADKVLELDPQSPVLAAVHITRGRSLLGLEQNDEALSAFDAALRVDPERAEAYEWRGRTKHRLGRVDDAIADFTQAIGHGGHAAYVLRDQFIEGAPDVVRGYQIRGAVHDALNRHQEAIADFTRVTELEPQDPVHFYRLGLAYRHPWEQEKAIASFTKAIELNPDYLEAYGRRGTLFERRRAYAKAEVDYGHCIRLRPEHPFGYRGRGDARMMLGKHAEAEADYTEMIRLRPNEARGYSSRAWVRKSLRKYAEAVADYSRAIELKPREAWLYVQRSHLRGRLGDAAGALADTDAAIRLTPKDPFAHAMRAWLLATSPDEDLRDGPQAVASATKACEMTKYKESFCLRSLAAACAEAGDFESAVKWATKVVELSPPGKVKEEDEARLALYQARQPYRDQPER